MNNSKQIATLKNATMKKKHDTLHRVQITIEQMQQNDIPINFQSVAKQANVSKTWLYAQSDIVNQIQSLRDKSGKIKRLIDTSKQFRQKESEITHLKHRIQQLILENKELKQQLEVLYGKLYEHNIMH